MSMALDTFAASLNYTTTTTTSSSGGFMIGGGFFWVIVILAVLAVAGMWRVFQKAGRHGWAAIIPIYNIWTLFEIVGMPAWWSILSIIPLVNIFTAIMEIVAMFRLPKLFGKGTGFCIANIFFGFITMPILGFGSAQFHGDDGSSAPTVPETPYPTVPPTTPPPTPPQNPTV